MRRLVDYDAAKATVEDMAKAVASAVGPLGQRYTAYGERFEIAEVTCRTYRAGIAGAQFTVT